MVQAQKKRFSSNQLSWMYVQALGESVGTSPSSGILYWNHKMLLLGGDKL